MITHEIKKPAPPNVYQAAKATVMRLVGHQQQQQHTNLSGLAYMPKLQFTAFIEGMKKEWPKGSYCTLHVMGPITGKLPNPLFIVKDHQEISWNAALDSVHNQPRCIYVTNDRYQHTHVAYPPGALRHLTDEEQALVDLRDKTKPAYEPQYNEELTYSETTGEWFLKDNLTKKVLRTFPRA